MSPRPEPPYLQVVNVIEDQIRKGDLAIGSRIPPIRDIATEHQIAYATAAKAIDELRQRGLVSSRPGAGTVVVATTADSGPDLEEKLESATKKLRREIRRLDERITALESKQRRG